MTMDQAVQFLMNHGVVVLFVAVLAEQARLPAASVPLLLAIGSLASLGRMNLTASIGVALAACLIADSLWYTCSKQLHRVTAYGSRFGLVLSVAVTCVFAVVALVLSVRRR
jgi:membrane protein DedA with SNARE-associated domain